MDTPVTDPRTAPAGPTPCLAWRPHLAHWGAFQAAWYGQQLLVHPHADDPHPNPIIATRGRSMAADRIPATAWQLAHAD